MDQSYMDASLDDSFASYDFAQDLPREYDPMGRSIMNDPTIDLLEYFQREPNVAGLDPVSFSRGSRSYRQDDAYFFEEPDYLQEAVQQIPKGMVMQRRNQLDRTMSLPREQGVCPAAAATAQSASEQYYGKAWADAGAWPQPKQMSRPAKGRVVLANRYSDDEDYEENPDQGFEQFISNPAYKRYKYTQPNYEREAKLVIPQGQVAKKRNRIMRLKNVPN